MQGLRHTNVDNLITDNEGVQPGLMPDPWHLMGLTSYGPPSVYVDEAVHIEDCDGHSG